MTTIDYCDQTTIVTGASSGLGAEFARQLAGRGSNLVLVARRAERLQSLADELTRAHGVTVTTLARNLGAPDAGRTLRAELESRGTCATGLVNNAGFGTHNPFTDENPERLQDMIALNVGALVDLSRAYIGPLTAAGTGRPDQRREPPGIPADPIPERLRRHQGLCPQLHRIAVGRDPRHRSACPGHLPRCDGDRVL